MNTEYVDVVIIGAGLSGIGAACHLTKHCPDKTYKILEARNKMGGTWELFKYPGIRSDSDMFTLGYNFKPWTSSKFLADGPAILNYIKEAADEFRVPNKIKYNANVQSIEWCSESARWTLTYVDSKTKKKSKLQCNFISSCTGYYSYEGGYQPDFPGMNKFKGQFIHPQEWPENIDYVKKEVVVIGSGATAVTIVPEMSRDAAKVTMLQRSPTYMASVPNIDPTVSATRKVLPEKWAYRVSRTQKILLTYGLYYGSRAFPGTVKKALLNRVKRQVGSKVDMKNFEPNYNPWDERMCAVKSGDLFKAVKENKVSIVTDQIERITETGILLKSGDSLKADVIVSATGLNLEFLGGIKIYLDGNLFDPTQSMNYKGVMFENLPNLSMTFGYTNASWTLKADLTAEYVTRLLKYMSKKGFDSVKPINNDVEVVKSDFLSFQSGYVQRAIHKFPKMGSKIPWRLYQSYPVDLAMLRFGKINDGKLQFSRSSTSSSKFYKKAS